MGHLIHICFPKK